MPDPRCTDQDGDGERLIVFDRSTGVVHFTSRSKNKCDWYLALCSNKALVCLPYREGYSKAKLQRKRYVSQRLGFPGHETAVIRREQEFAG
jgi:hypothetical protein